MAAGATALGGKTIYGAAVLMALVIIVALSRAVNRLSRATSTVSDGDFSVRIPTKRKDQIGQLQSDFNQMTEHLEQLGRRGACPPHRRRLEHELDRPRARGETQREEHEGLGPLSPGGRAVNAGEDDGVSGAGQHPAGSRADR